MSDGGEIVIVEQEGGEAALLPSIEKILLDRSLYEVMPVSEGDIEQLFTMRMLCFQIDAYCINCEMMMVFRASRTMTGGSAHHHKAMSNGLFGATLSCQRCRGSYLYYFRKSDAGLSKIGQYPSMEDIGSADIVKFRKIIRQEDYAELRRATGLFSHGIGIGAFVYLRRIFERLIYLHRDDLAKAGEPIEGFNAMRMDDKIGALAKTLPPALVENRKVYSILSVGIHELDEDTCRLYFPVVKAAIIEILEQDLAARERKKASEQVRTELAAIEKKLKEMRGD